MRIISGLYAIMIIYYLPLPLTDYLDNDYVIIWQKKGRVPHDKGPPPSKILDPYFFKGHPLWKS